MNELQAFSVEDELKGFSAEFKEFFKELNQSEDWEERDRIKRGVIIAPLRNLISNGWVEKEIKSLQPSELEVLSHFKGSYKDYVELKDKYGEFKNESAEFFLNNGVPYEVQSSVDSCGQESLYLKDLWLKYYDYDGDCNSFDFGKRCADFIEFYYWYDAPEWYKAFLEGVVTKSVLVNKREQQTPVVSHLLMMFEGKINTGYRVLNLSDVLWIQVISSDGSRRVAPIYDVEAWASINLIDDEYTMRVINESLYLVSTKAFTVIATLPDCDTEDVKNPIEDFLNNFLKMFKTTLNDFTDFEKYQIVPFAVKQVLLGHKSWLLWFKYHSFYNFENIKDFSMYQDFEDVCLGLLECTIENTVHACSKQIFIADGKAEYVYIAALDKSKYLGKKVIIGGNAEKTISLNDVDNIIAKWLRGN